MCFFSGSLGSMFCKLKRDGASCKISRQFIILIRNVNVLMVSLACEEFGTRCLFTLLMALHLGIGSNCTIVVGLPLPPTHISLRFCCCTDWLRLPLSGILS